MFKTTAIDTLKQDKKCQACWYMILSTMSGNTTLKQFGSEVNLFIDHSQIVEFTAWKTQLWGDRDIWKDTFYKLLLISGR